MSEVQFRFEKMGIGMRAADVSMPLFDLAETLDGRKFFRFAEQLRAATLSITNDIAEGSDDDFSNFLKFARRSVFEVANMLVLFERKGHLQESEISPLLSELQEQSKMIPAFHRTLERPK